MKYAFSICGPGNDIYFVDNLGDAVYENPNEGTDIVRVKVSGYTLPANVEIGAVNTATGLTLTGNNQGDILFGNNGDDVLIGGSGNDQFSAGLGNDIINGGAGTDAMSGGAGDDTFVFSATGFGNDTINDFNPTEMYSSSVQACSRTTGGYSQCAGHTRRHCDHKWCRHGHACEHCCQFT